MADRLMAMQWWGGKAATRPGGSNRWIRSRLPVRSAYVEPFAGMLGVLLARPRVSVEVVNDLDGRVVNWWTQVRGPP